MASIVTTDAAGTLILPADLHGGARPNTPYIVEADGKELSVRPQNGHAPKGHKTQDEDTADDWAQQWNDLAEQMSAFPATGKSAVEELPEMGGARG